MARQKRSLSTDMIETGVVAAPAPNQVPDSFSHDMAFHPNAKQGAEIVAAHSDQVWLADYGAELELVQQKIAAAVDVLEPMTRCRSSYCEALLETPRHVQRELVESAEIRANPGMNAADKRKLIILSLALIASITMGISNIVSNLMATGEPVFLDHPWLAVALAMLLPCGALALEQIVHFFEFERSRRRYVLGVNLATGLLLAAWLVLFSINFSGIAGTSIDVTGFGESDWSARIFSGVQTAAEHFVAATLMLAVEQFRRKYETTLIIENPRWLALHAAFSAFEREYAAFVSELGTLQGRKTQLDAMRQAFAAEKVAAYLALRGRRSL